MHNVSSEDNKAIYSSYADHIIQKRLESEYPIRRYAHHQQWQVIVDQIPAGATVLDAGCGEGVVSVMLAKKGCIVTGVDLSAPNIEQAKKYARAHNVSITFLVGDAEQLPVADRSFEYAISCHVLEHLPSFTKGASELARVVTKNAVVAIPTCLTLGGLALLGRDRYWVLSRRSLYAIPVGLVRVLLAFCTGQEGVNETYVGNPDLIHIWRFPWRGKQLLENGGLRIDRYGCSAIIFPYFSPLLILSKILKPLSWVPFFRNFGHGTTYVCSPTVVDTVEPRA
jgi:ubiquinone/menaquinone biosynthesis C-methylase UbiE